MIFEIGIENLEVDQFMGLHGIRILIVRSLGKFKSMRALTHFGGQCAQTHTCRAYELFQFDIEVWKEVHENLQKFYSDQIFQRKNVVYKKVSLIVLEYYYQAIPTEPG